MELIKILPKKGTSSILGKEEAWTYLQALLLTNKNLSTYEEIHTALEREFNCQCSMDFIMDYFAEQREIEDINLIHKHYGNDYQYRYPDSLGTEGE